MRLEQSVEQAVEPCLIHQAIALQGNALEVSLRLNPKKVVVTKHKENTLENRPEDVLAIYAAKSQRWGQGYGKAWVKNLGARYNTSGDMVYRIWRGRAYSEITGHKA